MNSSVGDIIFPSESMLNNKNNMINGRSVDDVQLLNSLYSVASSVYTCNFINTLYTIYDSDSFKLKDLEMLVKLNTCELLTDYSLETNDDKNKEYEKALNVYFSALSKFRSHINAQTFKHKICSLLKMDIKIPSYRNGISLKNINVNISTAYKAKDSEALSTTNDVASTIRSHYLNSLDSAKVDNFSYSPQMASVVLQGPILKHIMNSIVNLQGMLLETGKSFGVKLEPFIESNNSKLLL